MGVRTTQEFSEKVIRIETCSEKNLKSFPKPAVSSSSSSSSSLATTRSGKFEEQESKLWWIHGEGYDLDEFVSRHPGGKEAIMLGKGRDCTALVESYHAFSNQHWKVLEKFRKVGTAKGGKKPDFFYDVLKERVTAVLKERGIDPINDRGASIVRTLYYIFVFIAWIVTGYAHVKGSVLGSFGFAIFGWFMGALGHDAGHFAASRRAIVNEWGVWAMSLICNPVLWQHQHTYAHHSYTNEFDHDPDIHHFDTLLRVHKKIRYDAKYRYQTSWLYVLFAYIFVVFGTCFYIPWGMIESGSLYGLVDWQDKDRPSKAFGMRVHMALYVFVIMVLPFFVHSSPWMAALAAFVHIATLGVVFAIFSQINHLNESSLDKDMKNRAVIKNNRDKRLVDSWAAAQVETSNNFASNSLLWHVLSNGLNHQIEHHLFPGLNHCHLHHIAPTVRKTCEEFGVEYKCLDTWGDLMNETMKWYSKLSIDETAKR